MIDNFKIECRKIDTATITKLISQLNLDSYSSKKGIEYNNKDTKNFTGGLFIQITFDKKLFISGSLHKYKNYLTYDVLQNFDAFTMLEASETFKTMLMNLDVQNLNFNVVHFEVGISIKVDFDIKELLSCITSIGNIVNSPKLFYLNPAVKDERMKVTSTHRDFKKVFKVYDKVNEMKDKRKTSAPDFNVLRIETVYRRQENKPASNFFTLESLEKIRCNFFKEWDSLNFEYDIKAPKGTHKIKCEIAKDILFKGTVEVLQSLNKEYLNGVITKRIYYNLKDFIDEWHNLKFNFSFIHKRIVTKFFKTYTIEKQYYTDNSVFY